MSIYNEVATAPAAGLGYSPGPAGGSEYLTASTGALGAAWSVELWLRTSKTGVRQTLLTIGGAGQPFVLELDTSGKLNAYILPKAVMLGTVNVADGASHHVAVTCNGAATSLYRDGALVTSVNAAAPINGTSLHVATGQTLGFASYTGTLDEVALYSGALSAAQVLNHYHAGHFGAATISWTWQNEIESAQFGTLDLQANHVRVFAKGVQAEAWDYPAVEAIGTERHRHIVDRLITSNAQAAIRAANELWMERRKAAGGELHVPLNPGLEVLDVVEVVDSPAGVDGAYRCAAITAAFDVLHATYDMTLALTGV